MDNQTNTPNQDNNSTTKKPIQLYLTVSLIVLTIISIILSSVCIGVVINKDKPVNTTVEIIYNYTLTSQYTLGGIAPTGSLLIKNEPPQFYDNTLFPGRTMSVSSGIASDSDFYMTNPRMSEGYDANIDYKFIGWYTSPTYETKWNFSEDRIWRTTYLYAKWTEKA